MNNSTEPGIPEYVSVGFVAKHCGVSNTTVLRWIGSGELVAFRLPGGHYRIDNRDFTVFTHKYRIPVNTPPPNRLAIKKKNKGNTHQAQQ